MLTDADCQPTSDKWIEGMVRSMVPETRFVLGYGALDAASGILNKLIRFETLLTACLYLSAAILGRPYMGVGRNLLCRRDVFEQSDSLQNAATLSGDDDLLVNEMATGSNTQICIDPSAFTKSEAPSSWRSWWDQKRRHLSAGFHYKAGHRVILGGNTVFHLLFYILLLISITRAELVSEALLIFFGNCLLQWALMYKPMRKLKVSDLWTWIPVLDPLYITYLTIVGAFAWQKKKQDWK